MQQKIKQTMNQHLETNISIYTFTIVLFLMGIIFGAIVVNSLPYNVKQDLFVYLSRFFGELSSGKIAVPSAMFHESASHYLQYVGFMWLLGISIVGLPIIFILLFLKGIVVGFTVGFLVNQMGFHGFLVSLTSVFPQNLIVIPTFIIVSTAAVGFSFKMIRQLLIKTKKDPLMPEFVKYTSIMFAIVLVLLIVSAYEAYLSPLLIKTVTG